MLPVGGVVPWKRRRGAGRQSTRAKVVLGLAASDDVGWYKVLNHTRSFVAVMSLEADNVSYMRVVARSVLMELSQLEARLDF